MSLSQRCLGMITYIWHYPSTREWIHKPTQMT